MPKASHMKLQHKYYRTWTYVETSGDGIGGEIGAAATSPMINHTRKAYIGDSTTSTVYTAEL